jgi:hydroxymethylpyrimidine pyrophosphatase-like HAD family hydrolase
MKHKVVFLDLDGTLITVGHGISKYNILALEKFINLGGDIVLSTGRSIVSALKIAQKITKKINYKFK